MVDQLLLPPPLAQDGRFQVLGQLSSRISAHDLSPLLIYLIDNVDASALPLLAEQFSILGDAGWDMADTEAKKRALLKQAIELHRIKGTPYAIQRALKLLGINASLKEWFETTPRGEPHTFSINAQVTDQPDNAPAIDAERINQIRRVVSFWKPARSHFSLQVGAQFTHPPFRLVNAAGAFGQGRWSASPTPVEPAPLQCSARLACAAQSLTVCRISMET